MTRYFHAVALVLALGWGGCTTTSSALKQAHSALDATITAANKAYHIACKERLKSCKARGVKTRKDCASYIECDMSRARTNEAVEKIEDGLILLDEAIKKARKEGLIE